MGAPAWFPVGFVPAGPQGDSLRLYEVRDAPNSLTVLWAQPLSWDSTAGEYVDDGLPYEVGTVYDGWVQVGFWLPYMVDNQDGTIEFWRQWYCRESAESNVFNPDGDPVSMGTATLPIGTPGPYYVITATNPVPDVTYFWRELYIWDYGTETYVGTGDVQQFGGVIAEQGEPGPQGDPGPVGDYYLIDGENPAGDPEQFSFYRTRYDGLTETAEGVPEQIGNIVAAQGPQGPTGPQGPPGAGEGIQVNPDWYLAGEFERLSFLSRQLAEMWCYSLSHVGLLVDAVTGYEANAISAAGVMIGRGRAAPVWAAVGTAVGAIGQVLENALGYAIETVYGPLETEQVINDVAEAIYCALVPYRYFDNTSLDNFITTYYGLDGGFDLVQGNYADGVLKLIALKWDIVGNDAARNEMGIILSQYFYNAAWDYTALPCTPDLGTWQRVYDFTLGMQTWVLDTNNRLANPASGAHVAGVGWQGTNYKNGQDFVSIMLPHACTFTYMEILFSRSGHSGWYNNTWRAWTPEAIGWNANNPGVGNNLVVSIPIEITSTEGHYVGFTCANAGTVTIHRISVTGTGDAPPEP